MSPEEVKKQSEVAYHQWAAQWREHAIKNGKLPQKPLSDFLGSGVGRPILCIANGYSFEENLKTIKDHRGNIDILCCDKTLGHLLNNGIRPTFCVVCDANVNYEKYLKPWEGQLSDTVLFSNICGNPEWTHNGNWKDIYFFVNKDVLNSEKEFSSLSGCHNFIPAGTNVSNAMVVFLTQSDENGPQNYFGYDKILLIGFDYCWKAGKYYAFDHTGNGKDNYMRHLYLLNGAGEYVYTSGNLFFSHQWLARYLSAYRLPVVQCSKKSLLTTCRVGDLKEQMSYEFCPEDSEKLRSKIKIKDNLLRNLRQLDDSLGALARKHAYNFLATT
jgi:hypothetical protein